ncbi:MBOAT family O-acyltransferase [Parabacteroides sp.]
MLFNSFEFLVYLPLVFLSYWFVFGRSVRLQNLFVVFASYLFYGWWDVRFLSLIACTSFFSWLSGIGIQGIRDKYQGDEKVVRLGCRWVVAGNLLLNLSILFFFKYYDFFIDSFIRLFSAFGITLHASTLYVILPVGISFYTFQALSYTIDVYRGKLQPTKDIVAFFAYVSFFPQLVAGPIERATHLLVQFYKPRVFVYDTAVDGVRQMLWGFFKKVVIADNCAVAVNDIFDNYTDYSASTLWMGAVLFAFQIYGDFSGYSDIAIGTAKLFGIHLYRNFNYPYFSSNIIDFWRRWHISLNTWFVDYVYIPLGGSWRGVPKYIRNVLIVFLLSGLWHGADWMFVTWGVYHGLLVVCLFLAKKYDRYWPQFSSMLSVPVTFVFVVVGWIFFRSETLSMAVDYILRLCSPSLLWVPKIMGIDNVYALISLCFIIVMLIVEWWNRDKAFGLDISAVGNKCVRYGLYGMILFSIYFFGNNASSFIYFQF